MTAGHRKKCLLLVVAEERQRRGEDGRRRAFQSRARSLWDGPREQDARSWVSGGGRWVRRAGEEET